VTVTAEPSTKITSYIERVNLTYNNISIIRGTDFTCVLGYIQIMVLNYTILKKMIFPETFSERNQSNDVIFNTTIYGNYLAQYGYTNNSFLLLRIHAFCFASGSGIFAPSVLGFLFSFIC
jgi:hypothetical protein